MIHVGTSGFNYPEWKGTFYPATLPASKMLPYYAGRFDTVEINATFYRMPTEKMLAGWAAQVPEPFRFSLKAPRRITHDRRLEDCAELAAHFVTTARTLGDRLGVLLFQLPPYARKNRETLAGFLAALPPRTRAAFEFRHESWWDDEIADLLEECGAALCVADSEDRHTPFRATADYGYLRLRDEGYDQAQVAAWAGRAAGEARWRETFVYFKHEEQGLGPAFAQTFLEALRASGAPGASPA
jgi:uncharacterized protein YecE (DUF72 family)